jgi:biotin operon repressor
MSQEDVYQILKKNKGKWMTSGDISKELDISRGNVASNLRKLRLDKSIKGLEVEENWSFDGGGWKWRLKK